MLNSRFLKRRTSAFVALACSAFLIAPMMGVVTADFAVAKNNGGGNGGGGHGGGNGGNHGQAGGATHGNSGGATHGSGTAAHSGQQSAQSKPSAHASPTALANAAPNSRIGRIRNYYEANQAAQQANSQLGGLQQAVDDADQALADAQATGVTDVTALQQAVTDAQTALTDAQAAATQAQAGADAALQAAANKEVTPEVKAELDRLLVGKITTTPPQPTPMAN